MSETTRLCEAIDEVLLAAAPLMAAFQGSEPGRQMIFADQYDRLLEALAKLQRARQEES